MSNDCTSATDAYFHDQIDKQYRQAVPTPVALPLQTDFCVEALANLTSEKLQALESLILYKNVSQLQAALDMSFFSVYDLTLFFLHRAIHLNDNYNAIISLNPNCLEHACMMDARLKAGEATLGLMGIPIWIKDNIATCDPVPTTGGAVALSHCFSVKDAPVVSELKKAGAIILGKTNLSEWANFMSSQSSNGYSTLGGQTRSPYGEFDVGGSSSGSAVAVALGLSPVTIGSETCGSLVYPASQNGVVTLKPPHESLSGFGVLPIASSLDTVGPISLTVPDAYLTYCALGGKFPQDVHPDFLHASLHKKRIGLALSPALTSEFRQGDLEFLYHIKEELTRFGAEVLTVNIPEAAFTPPLVQVLYEEFEPCLNDYFAYVSCTDSLQRIIQFNSEDMASRAPFGQDLLETCLKTTNRIASPETIQMQELCKNALLRVLNDHKLDAIYNLSNYLAVLHALSGFPALNVPCGQRPSGEPIGVTFISKPSHLKDLFEIAHLYQENTQHQRHPILPD
jgi:amidase